MTSDLDPFLNVIMAKSERIEALEEVLAKINKIATDARNGVHPADWRKDWQRNEWTKIRDLSKND